MTRHDRIDDVPLRPDFWTLPLEALNPAEWEALCDGCGKCCLLKLEDPDTGEIAYTDVSCRLLDLRTCRCGHYRIRTRLVEGCVALSPATLIEALPWMPATCAYRLRAEGRPLPDWHPLHTGRAESVVEAGQSVADYAVPEYEVDEADLDYRIIGEP
ncbi:MAG: YcgN family cysteine cluster protein [Pseudomonadota bacterium]